MEIRASYLLAGAVVVGAAAYLAFSSRNQSGGGLIYDAAESVGGGVVGVAFDAANGVVSGVVNTIGDVVGIERTDCQKCRDAMDEWQAAGLLDKAWLSFKVASACPAADYFKWVGDASYRPSCS